MLRKEVHFIIYIKKARTGVGKKAQKTRHNGEDWPYLNLRVLHGHASSNMAEKNMKRLFLFYFYLYHNSDILAYKYDTYLFILINSQF